MAVQDGHPTEDDGFGQVRIRKRGRTVRPVYRFGANSLGESRVQWDYCKLLQAISADGRFVLWARMVAAW